mgnify:FL=1
MRYQIQGDTLPVVICQLEAGERMIRRRYVLDVSEHEDGDNDQWRDWESCRKNVLRREDVPEYLHCTGRQRNDRICFLLSRIDSCI